MGQELVHGSYGDQYENNSDSTDINTESTGSESEGMEDQDLDLGALYSDECAAIANVGKENDDNQIVMNSNSDKDELIQCGICHHILLATPGNNWIRCSTCTDLHVCINCWSGGGHKEHHSQMHEYTWHGRRNDDTG